MGRLLSYLGLSLLCLSLLGSFVYEDVYGVFGGAGLFPRRPRHAITSA